MYDSYNLCLAFFVGYILENLLVSVSYVYYPDKLNVMLHRGLVSDKQSIAPLSLFLVQHFGCVRDMSDGLCDSTNEGIQTQTRCGLEKGQEDGL